jgi:hypothetical protein
VTELEELHKSANRLLDDRRHHQGVPVDGPTPPIRAIGGADGVTG